MDKLAYVFGTTMLIAYSYLMGKYPHTHIYTFVSVLLTGLLIHRYYSYALVESHYKWYLLDFCYIANVLLLVLINFAPKCQWLLITCYIFSNGPLAAAIAAFRNSLVYHRIDMLTSLAIHAIPMTLSIHIRWYTVPEQEHLPLEEQKFAPLSQNETWGDAFENLVFNPIKIYLCWLVAYGFINFVCTSRISSYELDSSYKTFTTIPALRKSVEFMSFIPMEIVFLLCHFFYYLVLHIWALLMYNFYYLNMAACAFWCIWSFFQGANYYMDYFAKKYESQLNKLSQLQEEVVATPTLKVKTQNSLSKQSSFSKEANAAT